MCERVYFTHYSVLLVLTLLLGISESQVVIPSSYSILTENLALINGSSVTGNCPNVTTNGNTTNCTQPASSVLFDGIIPTLTGLDGNMWASQLLTLRNSSRISIKIRLYFTDTPGYSGVKRVEVVLFNCPEWGIAARDIRIVNILETKNQRINILTNYTTFSCSNLVRLCSSASTSLPVLEIRFTGTWKHLAEVTFYASNSTCSPNTVITAPPTLPPVTTATTPAASDLVTAPSTSSSTIIAVSVCCVLLLLVCFLAAVLILWRYHYAKQHKHNTSHHTAVGEEGHTHSHTPPATLCEETGQVYYSTVEDTLGRVSQEEPNDAYSHLRHGSGNMPHGLQRASETDTPMDQLCAQVNKKKGRPQTSEAETSVNHLYAKVDKKETLSNTSEATGTGNQLYAQVNKKKKKGRPQTSEAETSVNQLYAEVDNKETLYI